MNNTTSLTKMHHEMVALRERAEKAEAGLAEAQAELQKLREQMEVEWREKILAGFPLLDEEGLCQEKHHCEWTLLQDRKRLHALLQSAEGRCSQTHNEVRND